MLARLAAFLLGLLAGAMLLIAVGVAPFWQTLPPLAFRGWFALHAWRIGRLMRPLGATAVLLVTVVVNEPANDLFARPGALTDTATTDLLVSWVRWHWVRVGLGAVGF